MKQLVTVQTLADRYQVKPTTIRTWVEKRQIPFVRVGLRAIRFDVDKVDQVLLKEIPEKTE